MIKAEIAKSTDYKDYEREEIYFVVQDSKGVRYAVGYGKHTARDYPNLINDISEINYDAYTVAENFDATMYSSSEEAMKKINEYITSSTYNYDKEKLEKELSDFVAIREKDTDAEHFQWLLREAEVMQKRDIEELQPKTKSDSLSYIQDFIGETINPTGNKIKTVNQRRKFWDKVLDKNRVDDDLFSNFEHLCSLIKDTKYIEQVQDLYREDFPDILKFKKAKDRLREERDDLYSQFNYDRQSSLRPELLKQYGAERIKGAMQLKYYEETNDISIFLTPKEEEEFNSMSFNDLVKKYGTDLITTHKGAALLTRKLHDNKAKGIDIKENLVSLKRLAKNAKSTVNNDMTVRRYIFDELSKDYQKFAPNDMEYREVFAELAPTSTEKAYLNHYLKETEIGNTKMSPEVVARLEEVKKQQDKFVKDSDFIITGKMSKSDLYEAKARITEKKKEETMKQAIKRVKEKHARNAGNKENVSGVVIADEIAERLKEGFEMPASKEKRDAIATNLRKKRSTTKTTKEISR